MTDATFEVQENGTLSEKLDDLADKREVIARACREGDWSALVGCADTVGGLVDDELRATAWPLLLGVTNEASQARPERNWQDMPRHSDEEQVQKDVDRSFVYYPSDESQESLEGKRKSLFGLIVKVLRSYPMLHYFQGYHDIVQVFLLVLGEDAAYEAVSRVSLVRIRDYMLESLGPSTKQLHLIPAILKRADPQLAELLSRTPPYFALSAVLTLYAHDIQEYSDIARLYDFILAHEPVITIYLFAALIISQRAKLLEIEADDEAMMLFTLSKLPQPLNLQALIDRSLDIFRQHPPDALPGRAWYNISSYSVLKTSRQQLREQSLREAQEYFTMQSRQLAREQRNARLWKQLQTRRRPLISLGVTVLVGVLSYYLRRNGHDRMLWTLFLRAANIFSR